MLVRLDINPFWPECVPLPQKLSEIVLHMCMQRLITKVKLLFFRLCKEYRINVSELVKNIAFSVKNVCYCSVLPICGPNKT